MLFLTELWSGTTNEPQTYYQLINLYIEAGEPRLALEEGEAYLATLEPLVLRKETYDDVLVLYDWVMEAARLAGDLTAMKRLSIEKNSLSAPIAAQPLTSTELARQDQQTLIANHRRLVVEPTINR